MSAIEDAVIALLNARREQAATRRALLEYRQEHKSCRYEGQNEDGTHTPHCFMNGGLPFNYWCECCRGAQPLWKAKQRAAYASGAAIRTLLILCANSVAHAKSQEVTDAAE